jgi:hypothetical protein
LRANKNVWIPLPHEVDEWWRARSVMQLTDVDGTWRVEGAGSERARVAYARVERDGKLSYGFASK